MTESPYRAGHVAVLGRPNVGKSTLINALVGSKVSIVSQRPQTTRHRLLGIATFPEGQLLLVDTPGIHRGLGTATASAMHKMMNRAARGALEGVDAAMLVVRAGQWSEEDTLAYDALKNAGVPVVLVHMRGEPRSMQTLPDYDDVVADVHRFLAERIFAAEMSGIPKKKIVVDPGFGFGKTTAHNLALLAQLERFADLGVPVLAGLSRKRSIGELTGRDAPHERVHGSVAAHLIAAQRGAKLLRVHDVAATVDALKVWHALADVSMPRASASKAPAIRWPDDD